MSRIDQWVPVVLRSPIAYQSRPASTWLRSICVVLLRLHFEQVLTRLTARMPLTPTSELDLLFSADLIPAAEHAALAERGLEVIDRSAISDHHDHMS